MRRGLKPPCQQWRVLRQATQICCRFQASFRRWAVHLQWILYNCPIPMLPFLPLFPCDRLREALRSTLVPFYSGSLPVSFILTHQELDSCGFRLPATGIRSQLWICLRPGFHLFLPVTCNCGNTRTT